MITVICDSREQTPWRFSENVKVVIDTLKTGDYQIMGLDKHLVIERKAESDLLGTITTGRDTFIKELERMTAFRMAILIIESDWWTFETGSWRSPSRVHPNSVVGSILAFALKYRVMPILAGDHETAGRIAERLFIQYAAMLERDYKLMTKINGGSK